MRIALVANAYPPFFIGGAEIAAHRQAMALIRRGHELSCFCAVSDDGRRAYAQHVEDVDGVQVTRVNVPGFRFTARENFANVIVEARFRDFLERRSPDVVHFHNTSGLSLSLLDVCEEAGVPSMLTLHDHWGFCLRNTLVRRDETRVCADWEGCGEACLQEADYLGLPMPVFMRTDFVRAKLHKASLHHYPSRYLLGAYERASFDGFRAVQHTYGIEPHWFEGDVEPPPSSPGDPVRIAFVAYLSRHKGPQTLFDALVLLEEQDLLGRFQVDVYGRGDMEADMAAVVAERGWGERVRLHGKTDNAAMPTAYRSADVMVNCSLWPENEPLTILEALACGVPVIATALGGNVELVRDGDNGWLFEAGSAESLAARLADCAADPGRLRAMRGAARLSVADRTIAAYAGFAEAAYRSLTPPTAAMLPSLAAVFCKDFGAIDAQALHRAARSGYFASLEWMLAEALRGPSEIASVRVAVSLDGRLDAPAAHLLSRDTPVLVLGPARDAAFDRFDNVRSVESLEALSAFGHRLAERAVAGPRELTNA